MTQFGIQLLSLHVKTDFTFLDFYMLFLQPKMKASHSLVLSADTGAGRTDLTCRTLEFGVFAFADSTLAFAAAITELPILGKAGGFIQGTFTGIACVVGVTDALPAFAASMS